MAMKSAPPPPAPDPVNSVPSQFTTSPVITSVSSSVDSPHSPVADPPKANRAKAGMISITAASQRGMAKLGRSLIPAVGTVTTSGRPAASAAVTSAGTGERVTGPAGAISPPAGGSTAGGGEGGSWSSRSGSGAPSVSASGRSTSSRGRFAPGGGNSGAPATDPPPAQAASTSSTVIPVSVARAAADRCTIASGTPRAAAAALRSLKEPPPLPRPDLPRRALLPEPRRESPTRPDM